VNPSLRQALLRVVAFILAAAAALALLLPARPSPRPWLAARTIVNAADRRPGAIAPGEVLTIFGSNAGPAMLAAWPNIFPRNPEDFRYTREPLGGTRVLVDGIAAPIVYTVRGETQVIVPDQVADRAAVRLVLEYRGIRSAPVILPIAPAAPGIFTLDGSGTGQAAMLNEAGCCNSPRNPARRGSVVELYGTGEGIPGGPQWPPAVTVGGVVASIQYANRLGILVVNFRVPDAAPAGDAVPVALSIGGRTSRPGVTMAIRADTTRVFVAGRDLALAASLRKAGCDLADEGGAVDVAVLPLRIPEDEARTTLSALRAANPKVRILAVADAADSAALRMADLLGAQALLTTPVSSEALLRCVRRLAYEPPARY
jgi:uncharacterized protein (TIGR03437 family)